MKPEQETVTAEFRKVLALPSNGVPENLRQSMMGLFESWHAVLVTQNEIGAAELQRRLEVGPEQKQLFDRAWTLYFYLILNTGWARFQRNGMLKY